MLLALLRCAFRAYAAASSRCRGSSNGEGELLKSDRERWQRHANNPAEADKWAAEGPAAADALD